ncbi:hypothetical protein KKE34_02765 [Patescibacteria group bacterium]|nr:hypothetical protein [Patescibacteria group bacterium]MBU1885511.1 hypothetical protein [Patescibacteria group bacterium]
MNEQDKCFPTQNAIDVASKFGLDGELLSQLTDTAIQLETGDIVDIKTSKTETGSICKVCLTPLDTGNSTCSACGTLINLEDIHQATTPGFHEENLEIFFKHIPSPAEIKKYFDSILPKKFNEIPHMLLAERQGADFDLILELLEQSPSKRKRHPENIRMFNLTAQVDFHEIEVGDLTKFSDNLKQVLQEMGLELKRNNFGLSTEIVLNRTQVGLRSNMQSVIEHNFHKSMFLVSNQLWNEPTSSFSEQELNAIYFLYIKVLIKTISAFLKNKPDSNKQQKSIVETHPAEQTYASLASQRAVDEKVVAKTNPNDNLHNVKKKSMSL